MDSPHPLLDAVLWLRFLAGALVVLVVPGYLLVGRFLDRNRWLARGVYAVAAGLLLVPLLGLLLGPAGGALRAVVYVPVACALGLGLGRWARWRAIWGRLVPDRPASPPLVGLTLLGAVGLFGWIVLRGWGQLTAPLGDGANHAFLVWRIDAIGTFLPDQVFAPPYGSPGFVYFAGWHAAAAMIAQIGGLAPWIAAWLLPVGLLLLLPLACWLLWQDCGLDAGTAALASLLLAGFHYFPAGLFPWSGLGIIVSWFTVPFLVAGLLAVQRVRTVAAGVTVGLLAVSLLFVHASALVLVAVFGLTALAVDRADQGPRPPRGRRAWAACLGVVLAGAGITLAAAGASYGLSEARTVGLGAFVSQLRADLREAPHSWFLVRACLVPGLVLGLRSRRLRPFSAFGLVLVVLYVWLLTSRDPVILRITRLFYQEPARLRYVLCFWLPVWIALGMAWLWARLWPARSEQRAGVRAGRTLAAIGCVVVLLNTCGEGPTRMFRGLERDEAFGPADLEQAHRLAQVLPEYALVANLHRDGSHWAMHASGRRFLRPATWPLQNPGEASARTDAVLALAHQPWPDKALALRAAGVTHLYVSDTYETLFYSPPAKSPFTREHFRADPRFRVVDEGEHATVFAIDWEE